MNNDTKDILSSILPTIIAIIIFVAIVKFCLAMGV